MCMGGGVLAGLRLEDEGIAGDIGATRVQPVHDLDALLVAAAGLYLKALERTLFFSRHVDEARRTVIENCLSADDDASRRFFLLYRSTDEYARLKASVGVGYIRAREDALRDAQALKAVKAERENDAETVREWQKLLKRL